MMFKHHASRFFSLAILTLLIASCSSAPNVVDEVTDVGYVITADSDGTVTVEEGVKLASGAIATLSELKTQQDNSDAGTVNGDLAQNELVLVSYQATVFDAADGTGDGTTNGNPERLVIVDTRWRNDLAVFLRRGLTGNRLSFRLDDCFVVTAGSGFTSVDDPCLFSSIPIIGNEDVGGDDELDPSEEMPQAGSTFDFRAVFENGDRIRFFVVGNSTLRCTDTVDIDPGGSSCTNL